MLPVPNPAIGDTCCGLHSDHRLVPELFATRVWFVFRKVRQHLRWLRTVAPTKFSPREAISLRWLFEIGTLAVNDKR